MAAPSQGIHFVSNNVPPYLPTPTPVGLNHVSIPTAQVQQSAEMDTSSSVTAEERTFVQLQTTYANSLHKYFTSRSLQPALAKLALCTIDNCYLALHRFAEAHPRFKEKLPFKPEFTTAEPKVGVQGSCPRSLYKLLIASDEDITRWLDLLIKQPYSPENMLKIQYLLRTRPFPSVFYRFFEYVGRQSNANLRSHLLLHPGSILKDANFVDDRYQMEERKSIVESLLRGILASDRYEIDRDVIRHADVIERANLIHVAAPFLNDLLRTIILGKQEAAGYLYSAIKD